MAVVEAGNRGGDCTMTKPGTRRFIGPLTPAQQRRRERARESFRFAHSLSDARGLPMRDAFVASSLKNLAYEYRGYATGEYL